MRIERYKTLVFDCDGVILDSNHIKTEAFYRAALPYGDHAAKALVEFHKAHGGVSRYRKFKWLLEKCGCSNAPAEYDALLNRFAGELRTRLLHCEIAPGLEDLRQLTGDATWLVVSGGDENELNEIFRARGLLSLFDGGVFGSPATKERIFETLGDAGKLTEPAVYIGDSEYDFQCATRIGLDFIFVAAWSEWTAYETSSERFAGLVNHLGALAAPAAGPGGA